MNKVESAYFLYGYLYKIAEELSELACYKDTPKKEIIEELMSGIKNKPKK